MCQPRERNGSPLGLPLEQVETWATWGPAPGLGWSAKVLGLTSVCICGTWLGDTPLVWIGFPCFQIVGSRVIVFLIWLLKANKPSFKERQRNRDPDTARAAAVGAPEP